jgi:hypothetical protein
MNNNNNNDEYDNTELDESQVQDLEEERLSILEENNIDEMSVLTEANKHIGLWEQYFTENKTLGKSDMEFALRDQWTAIERGEFQRLFKPAMQFNKLYDPIKKIIGEQRRNTPDLKVRSLTGKATKMKLIYVPILSEVLLIIHLTTSFIKRLLVMHCFMVLVRLKFVLNMKRRTALIK